MKADNADRKRATRNSIYRYLYNNKEFCSRQTLANELGLSLPTVYQNLSELMEAGLVYVTDERLSTGGRRVEGLSIMPGARCAIGASISADGLRISHVDLLLTAEVKGIPLGNEHLRAERGVSSPQPPQAHRSGRRGAVLYNQVSGRIVKRPPLRQRAFLIIEAQRLFQSLRNRSIPMSVSGCFIIWQMTL